MAPCVSVCLSDTPSLLLSKIFLSFFFLRLDMQVLSPSLRLSVITVFHSLLSFFAYACVLWKTDLNHASTGWPRARLNRSRAESVWEVETEEKRVRRKELVVEEKLVFLKQSLGRFSGLSGWGRWSRPVLFLRWGWAWWWVVDVDNIQMNRNQGSSAKYWILGWLVFRGGRIGDQGPQATEQARSGAWVEACSPCIWTECELILWDVLLHYRRLHLVCLLAFFGQGIYLCCVEKKSHVDNWAFFHSL